MRNTINKIINNKTRIRLDIFETFRQAKEKLQISINLYTHFLDSNSFNKYE